MDTLVVHLEAFAAMPDLESIWAPSDAARWRQPPEVPEFYLTTLLYADDVTMLAATIQDLQRLLDERAMV
jgi:hypothetical protein